MKPLFLSVSLLLPLAAQAQIAAPAPAQTNATAPQKAPQFVPVTVRVLDAKNAPVVGANVEAQIWREAVSPIPGQITGADGMATLQIPVGADGKMSPGGVSVVAPGFAFANAILDDKPVEIKLEPGVTWRGKVVDEAGKPVADAKVSVKSAIIGNDFSNLLRLFGEKNGAAYSVKSGADGSFAVENVPTGRTLQWSVERTDYAIQNGSGALAEAEMTVKLAPGGAMQGRVLDLEGKPLADALVYARSGRVGGGNSGKTDANGAFTVSGLTPGNYDVGAYLHSAKRADFVLPTLKNVPVEVGKTASAPEIRAVKGVEIKGIVRDAKTQAPLSGANVIAQQGNEPGGGGVSDDKGQFSFRVLEGNYKVYISGQPEGYIRPETQQNATPSAEAPAQLVFELQKAGNLSGVIVDDAGKPLQIKLKIDYNTAIESDAAGKWKFTPQSSRELQIGGGEAEDGFYEVISPRTIPLDTEGETTITLRKKPWQVLPGRALTTDGQPLEGAKIEASFYTPMGDGNGALQTSTRTALSNKNGDFVVPRILNDVKSGFFNIKGTRDGYAFQKGGELSKNGPLWQVSDFVFAALNLEISGKTAPGARLTAAGTETVAGPDGAFTLAGLPADARIWAFKDDKFGGAEAKTAQQIELRTQELQARDPELARDIWRDIATEAGRGTKGKSYNYLPWISRQLATETDADPAKRLANATGDNAIAQLGEKLAPQLDGATLETAFARIGDKDMRLYAYLSAAAKSDDPALVARALKEAETTFAAPETSSWWRETNLYRTAPVAAKAGGEAAGFAALDRAIAYTLKNHGLKSTRKDGMPSQTGQGEMMALSAEIVAQGGLPLVRRLISNIEPGAGYDVRALAESIPILAKKDPESVLPLLDELEKMPEATEKDEGYAMPPQYAFAKAASEVVPLLGAKSPEKALALARRVRGDDYRNESKSRALASAAKFQTGEAAAKLWREIVAGASSSQGPRFAARAFETDPKLGAELFAIARQKVETDSKNEWEGQKLWANYAFYAARVQPAESRYLIEREWGKARGKKTEGDQLGALSLAMSATDALRAWQMAREIPTDDRNTSFNTRRKIGIYLNASDAARRDFPFDEQGNWEEWRAVAED